MSGYVECFRSAVYPWHCDHQGHMTTMFYFSMFDPACWHLLSAVGFTREQMNAQSRGFVDATSTIEYRAERRAGDLIVIEGGLLRIGGSSLTAYYRMKDPESDEIAATLESVSVYFDLNAREKIALADDQRERLKAFLVEKAG